LTKPNAYGIYCYREKAEVKVMKLTFTGTEFEVKCRFEDKELVKRGGRWTWDGERKIWHTPFEGIACFLYMFADETCQDRLRKVFEKVPDAIKQERALTDIEIESVRKAMTDPPKNSNSLTPKKVETIHQVLRTLAGMCDGAYARDFCGFNANDATFGRDLALKESLSYKQAWAGFNLLRKYHRQIPEDQYVIIYGKPYEKAKPKKEKKEA
jgi:hypothetical protein